MRYDACIIGAGAEGLTCAALLAARGLGVIVLERDRVAGGRCTTLEFVPGHRASPFCDELPAIPDDLFRALDLARHGAIFAPSEPAGPAAAIREKIVEQVMAEADAPRPGRFGRSPPMRNFPGDEWATDTLAAFGGGEALAPSALCDVQLPGSALGLLATADGGLPRGGLGSLGEALKAAAEEAGATIRCGAEVTDIRRRGGRAVAVGLADGSEVAARAVISTLDLRRTFLSLFAWNELPKPVVERIGAFRAAPGIARLLVALATPPSRNSQSLRRPARLWSTAEAAYRAWRSGAVPEHPPAELRVVSAVDPFLAPDGAATLTVTLGAIPYSPFDGPWNQDKRESLRDKALAIVEEAMPGTAAKVKVSELILPPDIEVRLGLTEGDLAGGDFSPTQMLGFRPFPQCRGTRTPVDGLYLAGPSSVLGPLATCASGAAAAHAVLADLRAGRLR